MSILDTVKDRLQKHFNAFLTYIQTNADIMYGIDNDNSNENVVIPHTINATGFVSNEGADLGVDFSPMTNAGFYGWDYYYGRMNTLYTVDLSYVNGELTIGKPSYIGRLNVDGHNWEYLPDGAEPIMLQIINGYVEDNANNYVFTKSSYPDKPIYPSYYSDWSGTHIRFYQDNNGTPDYNGFLTTFPKANNTNYSATDAQIHFYNFLTETSGVYSYHDFSAARGCAGVYLSQLQDAVMITKTNNQSFINDYITNNNATNNYNYTYTTEHGDDVTVYYGDNYVIYKCDDDAEITYNENKEILDRVANQLNTDNNWNLKVPSYDEIKYGMPVKIEDIETEMPLAYISGIGGMVNYIKINDTDLASADDISDALSRFDITTIGKDLLRNFISFKCFAILSIDPDNTVTRQITVAGHGLKDANDNALQGQYIGGVKAIDFTVGTVPALFNDFRDYAPYTKIECYVPFCGWFSLPSWCIGKTITGTMFTDICNGTVKAVIYADSTVVSEVGGCCAFDIPFVAESTGAKAGAVISSALSTAAATAATVAVPNIGTGITAVSSAANTICAANDNATTLKGVLGDGSNLNGLLHCYLKITRPQSPTELTIVPYTYKHEFGVPCYKQLTMTKGDGFTQVNDANITGNMTAAEKQMIIDGFKHGLIL